MEVNWVELKEIFIEYGLGSSDSSDLIFDLKASIKKWLTQSPQEGQQYNFDDKQHVAQEGLLTIDVKETEKFKGFLKEMIETKSTEEACQQIMLSLIININRLVKQTLEKAPQEGLSVSQIEDILCEFIGHEDRIFVPDIAQRLLDAMKEKK